MQTDLSLHCLLDPICLKKLETRIDVYETLCPQQMLLHKGGKIKNWGGECRDVTPTKSLSQNIRVYWVPPVLVTLFVYGKRSIHKTSKQNLLYLISFPNPSPKTP